MRPELTLGVPHTMDYWWHCNRANRGGAPYSMKKNTLTLRDFTIQRVLEEKESARSDYNIGGDSWRYSRARFTL